MFSCMLDLCLDQVKSMASLLSLESMKDRMAACLQYEEKVVKPGVRAEALRLGVPLRALRFYFPNLWPEAEAGVG